MILNTSINRGETLPPLSAKLLGQRMSHLMVTEFIFYSLLPYNLEQEVGNLRKEELTFMKEP